MDADNLPGARTWEMFGWQGYHDDHWIAIGERRYVELHGCSEPTPVTVTEDPDGTHLGWIYADATDPVMIQHKKIFDIQFAYGSRVELERGRGEVVPLTIRERTNGGSTDGR